MSKIQDAIDYLGAVEVAPGRYAGRETDCLWRVYDTSALTAITLNLTETGNIFGQHLPLHKIPTMPAWWSPEQRFAWRYKVVPHTGREMEGYENKRWPEPFDFGMERITADLETGEEVSA